MWWSNATKNITIKCKKNILQKSTINRFRQNVYTVVALCTYVRVDKYFYVTILFLKKLLDHEDNYF